MPPVRLYHNLLRIKKKDSNYFIYATLNNDDVIEVKKYPQTQPLTNIAIRVFLDENGYSSLNSSQVVGIEFTENLQNVTNAYYAISDSSYNHKYFTNLNSITFIQGTTFESVTNASRMFYACNNLTTLDLSSATFESVTNASGMFYACNNLTTLDLSSAAFESVTNISDMFCACQNLTTIDWNYPILNKVKYLQNLFYQCYKLSNPKLDNATFLNAENIKNMFYMCYPLVNPNWDNPTFTKVTESQNLFFECNNLTNPKLSNATFEKVENIYFMFYGCTSLITLDLSSATFDKVEDASGAFCNCSNLTSIDLSSATFKMTTTISKRTFNNAGNTWGNTWNGVVTNGIFDNCRSLTTLDLSSATFESLTDADYMFYNCTSLANLITNENSTFPVSLNLKSCPLTYNSMLSVAKWIKGGLSNTLTFKQSAWNNLNSTQQSNIQQIVETEKSWTLAFAS